jgi:SAM-dependent methyltransferase
MSSKKIIKKIFFRPSWYDILINPYFIARYSLLKEIENFSKGVKNKKILDIGCGDKPYEDFFIKNENEYIGVDVRGGGHNNEDKKVDKYYDGETIPFDDEIFDIIISTQVLEHVKNPRQFIKESYRVLQDGGILFLTMPFVWPEHEKPFDFNRFTQYEHKNIFGGAGFDIKSIKSTCGVFGVCGQLISAFVFESIKFKVFKLVASVLICFPIQTIFMFFDLVFKKSGITLDYVVIAKK